MDVLAEIEHFERRSRKYNEIKNAEPEVRDNFTGFGVSAVVTSSVMIGISITGIFLNLLLAVFNKISAVGGFFLGIFSVLFGASFVIFIYRVIPDVVWQRKLNKKKIGIAAIILVILQALFGLALAVTGVMVVAISAKSCAR